MENYKDLKEERKKDVIPALRKCFEEIGMLIKSFKDFSSAFDSDCDNKFNEIKLYASKTEFFSMMEEYNNLIKIQKLFVKTRDEIQKNIDLQKAKKEGIQSQMKEEIWFLEKMISINKHFKVDTYRGAINRLEKLKWQSELE
jgi:hypothetical protein